MALAKVSGFGQHSLAAIDSKNFSRRPYSFDKSRKISTGSATHLKHFVPRFEVQSVYRLSPNFQRKEKQEVKNRVDRRQLIIAVTNKIEVVIETQR
jgi:hypothetical protein